MGDPKHEGTTGAAGTAGEKGGPSKRTRTVVAGAAAAIAAGALLLYAMGGTEAGPDAPVTQAATSAAATASQPADDGRVAGALPGEGNTTANCDWHRPALSVGGYDYFYSGSLGALCRAKVGDNGFESIRKDDKGDSAQYDVCGLNYDDGRLYFLEERWSDQTDGFDCTVKSVAVDGTDEREVLKVPSTANDQPVNWVTMYLYQHKLYIVSSYSQDEGSAEQIASCNTDGSGYAVLSTVSNPSGWINLSMSAGRVYYASVAGRGAGGPAEGKATVCSQAPDGSDRKVLYESPCDDLSLTVVGSKLVVMEWNAADGDGSDAAATSGAAATVAGAEQTVLTMDLDGGNVARVGHIEVTDWLAGFGARGIYLDCRGVADNAATTAATGASTSAAATTSAATGEQAAGLGAFSLMSYETGEKNDLQVPFGASLPELAGDPTQDAFVRVADAGDRVICTMDLALDDGSIISGYKVGAMNADGTGFVWYVQPKG